MNLLKLGKAMLDAVKAGVTQLVRKDAKQEAVVAAEHTAEAASAKAPATSGMGERLKEAASQLRQKLSRQRGDAPHVEAPEGPAVAAARPAATPERFVPPKLHTPKHVEMAMEDMGKSVKAGNLDRVKGNAIAVLESPEGAKNARRVSDQLMEARKGVTDPAERKQLSALLNGSQKKQVDMMVKREAEMASGRFHPDEMRGIMQTNLQEAQHLLASGATAKNAGDSLKLASDSLQRLKKIDPKGAEAELHKFSPQHQNELTKLMEVKPAVPHVASAAPEAAKPHPFVDQLGVHRPPPSPEAARPVHVASAHPAANEPTLHEPLREAAFKAPEPPVVVPAAGGPVRAGQEIQPFEFAEKQSVSAKPAKPDIPYERPVLSEGVETSRLNRSLAETPTTTTPSGVSGVDAMRQKIEALGQKEGLEEIKLGGTTTVQHGAERVTLTEADFKEPVRRPFPTLGNGP